MLGVVKSVKCEVCSQVWYITGVCGRQKTAVLGGEAQRRVRHVGVRLHHLPDEGCQHGLQQYLRVRLQGPQGH